MTTHACPSCGRRWPREAIIARVDADVENLRQRGAPATDALYGLLWTKQWTRFRNYGCWSMDEEHQPKEQA